MGLNHFLITRFSVPFDDYQNDKSGAKVRTPEWLEHRFRLFKTFCLPSVKAQTCQDFLWLVFFDGNTPEYFKKEIKNIKTQYRNFTPLFVDSASAFHTSLKQTIAENCKENIPLITSRIDNDDALHGDYIKTIQQHASSNDDDFLLNFKWGLQLDLKSGVLYQSKDESNPFITRICKWQNQEIKTVFEFGHHEAEKFLPIKQITNPRGWLVIIHDKNMLNTIGGKPLFKKEEILGPYNILEKGKKPAITNLLIAPVRFLMKAMAAKISSH